MYVDLEENFSKQVADLYIEHVLPILDLISEKYGLVKWQRDALLDIIKDAFLKKITLIKLPNIIKNNLNIKDEKIAKSISLDLTIHFFSLDKDHFKETDNLIESLGGKEAYWKKYSQYSNYWDEIVVAEPLPIPNEIEIKWRKSEETKKKEWEEAAKRREKEEAERKEKEKAERREREEAERKEKERLKYEHLAKKLVTGVILLFVVYEALTLISWNNNDSQGIQQEVSPISKDIDIEASNLAGIGMEFVLIPAGEFMMGAPSGEEGREDNEGPVHKVTIKEPFYLGKFEVTQDQWRKVMGSNPPGSKGDNYPVGFISWDYVQEFIEKLNEMEGTKKYRLPTEAEWEYACRAGKTTRYYFGDDESKLGDYAWYRENSDSKTHPVGQKNPNPWGLYDMHGNVLEWCQDSWHDNYDSAPSDGSAWEDGNRSYRVIRGGSRHCGTSYCRSAVRSYHGQGSRDGLIGFRVLMEATDLTPNNEYTPTEEPVINNNELNNNINTQQEVSQTFKDTDNTASYATANELVTKGNELGNLGRYDEAIEAYDKAIEIDPKFAIAWSNKGNVLGRSGRYNEAIEACEKAIEIDPKLAEAYQSKGISLIGLGRYDEAIQALDIAIEMKPNNPNAWTGKGIALRQLGRYDEASICYDKAAELESKI